MSVLTDLQLKHGVRTRLYLKIDGLQSRIWQDDGTGAAPADPANTWTDSWPTLTGWTQVANNGTITTSGSSIVLHVDNGQDAKWYSATKLPVLVYDNIADLGLPATNTLLEFQVVVSDVIIGNAYSKVGLFLWADNQNAVRCGGNATGVGRQSIVGNVDQLDSAYKSVTYPATFLMAWNNGSSAATNSRGDILAANQYAIYCYTGGTWKTVEGATTMPVTPTVVGVFAHNHNAATAEVGGTFTSMQASAPALNVDKVGLIPPEEISMSLDVTTFAAEASAMTFEVLDIKDTDGLSWWGKKIAPNAWDAVNKHWRINVAAAPQTYLNANATSIPLKDATGMPASGTIYIGQETATYTGVSAATVTGVNKGLYPVVGSTFGQTYLRPEANAAGYQMHIGTVPFTWHGRRVALYVTTYDKASEQWTYNGELLWCGRVSNTIQYSPKLCIWKLACESILADLDREIMVNPHKTNVKGINLTGTLGRSFSLVRVYQGVISGNKSLVYQCTVAAKWYADDVALAKAVKIAIDGATFVGTSTGLKTPTFHLSAYDGKYTIRGALTPAPNYPSTWVLRPWNPKNSADFCHALSALGFTQGQSSAETLSGIYTVMEFVADENYAESYHACNLDANNSELYLADAMGFNLDQGDDSITAAWVAGTTDKNTQYLAKYILRTTTTNVDKLSLVTSYGTETWYSTWAYVAQRVKDDDNAAEIAQIYKPCYITMGGTYRGPFGALLYPLLSTGTKNYNSSTFDKAPLNLSIGIQSALVDTDSFTAADATLSMAPLTSRDYYVVDKAISWADLVNRECKLYGYAVVWSRGKIRLRDVTYPAKALAEITIDESCRATRFEMPDVDMPVSSVVNKYKLKLGAKPVIEIADADSVAMFGAKMLEIEHPGASIATTPTELAKLVQQLLLNRPYRFPSPIVEITLAPHYMHRVYPGDVVLYVSTTTPDPSGSGTFAVSEYALVIDAAWNFKTHVGSATLMLLTAYASGGMPWAPAAIITAHSAGVVTLQALAFSAADMPDDGAAFGANDVVNIVERNPADPTSPQSWSVTLTDEYGAAGANQFTLSAALTGYDATKQYIMTHADFASVATRQKALGSWQAHATTEILSPSTAAYRYG